jgi:hypothetical protein
MQVKKKFLVLAMLAVVVLLCSSQPSHASSTVGFTTTDNGDGTWTYLWTVNYDGTNPTGYGQIEIYLPYKMNSATNNATTLNGANLITTGVNPYDDVNGAIVTYPWNALHFDATKTNWTQAWVDLETPDQEGFDPNNVAEIAFLTIAQDNAAGTYQYSFTLDQYRSSFFYELHDAREAEEGAFQEGVVPLPPSVLLLGSGLLGIITLRKKFRA